MEFDFYSPSRLHFGAGKADLLPGFIKSMGSSVLILTGCRSFKETQKYFDLIRNLEDADMSVSSETIHAEPSPEMIDRIVSARSSEPIDVVCAIGGGSVMDAGKAVSAMLPSGDQVTPYLEGVGHLKHDGKKIPFIAVPTTSGTGSEATKNAVISRVGNNGFKKSLRHDNFVPDMAVLDPELTLACPLEVTAACGMDALTQLLESLVSTKATPLTHSLAVSGLSMLNDSLVRIVVSPDDIALRSNISYAAYISGLTLANAGLGLVHGFAATLGGFTDIPHGTVCGTLIAAVTRENVEALITENPEHSALQKYAHAATLLDSSHEIKVSYQSARYLADLLDLWTTILKIPTLSAYGIGKEDIMQLAENSGLKNNPCMLDGKTREQILLTRL